MEDWRVIDGYDGAYWVSDQGRVWSTKLKRVLTLSKHTGGYLQASICGKSKYVHRLVANAFLKIDSSRTQVNHIDGNKTNNTLKNLEFVNQSENLKHTFSHLGRKHKSTPVARYSLNGVFVDSFESIREASRKTGSQFSHIRLCVSGRQSRTGLFMWRKKDDGYLIPPYRLGEKAPRAVKKLSSDGLCLAVYQSINAASVSESIDISSLHRVLKGRSKTVGGHVWVYA